MSGLNRITEILKEKFILIYFGLLFILLLLVYFSSFSYPPRSDYWSTAYFFHRIDILANMPTKWLLLFQYDPYSRVRFQPLMYVMLYLEKLIFGSGFVYFHIFNFVLYSISILLLYKLAINFCKSRLLIAAFVSVFAFLFSHFDVLCWSYHAYIIFGFCAFLLGFILYINFLRSGKIILLFFVSFLFLLGMLCYETFALWPLAIIILSYVEDLNKIERSKATRSYLLVIGAVYIFYITFFYLTRTFKVYEEPLVPLSSLLSIRTIVFSIFATCFNIIYNGVLVNLMPLLGCPIVIAKNLNLGGFLKLYPAHILNYIIFLDGGLFMIVLLWIMLYLFRHKDLKTIKVVTFFLFLLFSDFFLLFYFRTLTNTAIFNLSQFRYLYIPNAFVILIALYFVDRFLNPSKKKKAIMCFFLSMILILNIYTTRRYGISILNQQLAPLKKMLSNIKIGLKTGQINKENKLYLDDNIAERLPPLCWNREMGEYFMRGTYQWVFSDEEIKCFSSFEDAKWAISEKDFSIVNK